MRHPRTVMVGRDGRAYAGRRVMGDRPDGPRTEPIRLHPPESLAGETWESRLVAYRQHLRERHGLAMSRDGD